MLPSFNFPFGFYDSNNLISAQFPYSFTPLAPYLYVFYEQPMVSNNHVLKQNFEQSRSQKALSVTENQPFGRYTPRQPYQGSQQLVKVKVEKEEQNNIKPEKCPKVVKKGTNNEMNPSLNENPVYKPEESRFVKKNTESNIVSQIFSFFWSSDKHNEALAAILDTKPKVRVFQTLMKSLKVKCRAQLNRDYLKRLMRVDNWPLSFKKLRNKTRGHEELSDQELESTMRRLSFLYLRQLHRCSIMTSKKMNKKLWGAHFRKCSQIKEFLFGQKHD